MLLARSRLIPVMPHSSCRRSLPTCSPRPSRWQWISARVWYGKPQQLCVFELDLYLIVIQDKDEDGKVTRQEFLDNFRQVQEEVCTKQRLASDYRVGFRC